MTYSSAEDLARLKAKLDQLVSVGCRGFAVLWDDIDTHLRPADVGAFNTLADAHVKICNQVHISTRFFAAPTTLWEMNLLGFLSGV